MHDDTHSRKRDVPWVPIDASDGVVRAQLTGGGWSTTGRSHIPHRNVAALHGSDQLFPTRIPLHVTADATVQLGRSGVGVRARVGCTFSHPHGHTCTRAHNPGTGRRQVHERAL